MSAAVQREFPMSDSEFAQLCQLAERYTGIVLGEHKRHMVYGRLVRRLRTLGLPGFAEYLPLVTDTKAPETSHFINAITTNLTSFFREYHHFEYVAQQLCPQWERDSLHEPARLRIWSAGCSSGEEPYSIAMTLCEHLRIGQWDVRILATDLDSNILHTAAKGEYDLEQAKNLTHAQKKAFFERQSRDSTWVRVKAGVRDLIHFKRLNLLEPWPMKGPFDLIFCRNVMIYFDAATQRQLLQGYYRLLRDGGHLMIGHSESLPHDLSGFEPLGKTIYRKRGAHGPV